jgi:hypothetical protein
MSKTSRTRISADHIAEKASRGEDISAHFTQKFTVVRPVRRVNIDLTQGMLRKLDERAARLNISRQAVIKTLLEGALEEGRSNAPAPRKKAGYTQFHSARRLSPAQLQHCTRRSKSRLADLHTTTAGRQDLAWVEAAVWVEERFQLGDHVEGVWHELRGH